jgi:Cu/Ag efflux pump CusA
VSGTHKVITAHILLMFVLIWPELTQQLPTSVIMELSPDSTCISAFYIHGLSEGTGAKKLSFAYKNPVILNA